VSSRALVIQHRARSARSRSPRIAVTAVFVAHGLLFASWTAHIPHIMRHLGLSDGTLGIALLGAPVGSVAAMLLASLSLALGLLPFLTAFVAVGTLLSRALRDAPQGPASPARSDGTP
jgi:hypothetical protein